MKKAEHQRTDPSELRCWRRLPKVSRTARRSNQSVLKEISPEYSLEGLMLSWNSNTLATWCEEMTHWKRSWCWERLKAGGERDNRGWDARWHHQLDGQEFQPALRDGEGQGSLCAAVHAAAHRSQRVGYNWVTELNWTLTGFSVLQKSIVCDL